MPSIRRLIVNGFTCGTSSLQNLHDFRYEGGAPINSGPQITLVNEKRECGIDLCFVGCQRLRVSVLGGGSFAAFACYE